MKWHSFDPTRGYRQKRPPIKKYVLVRIAPRNPSLPEGFAVGYRKDAAGCKNSPYFVIPGIGGDVLAWCDCLPADLAWPKPITQEERVARRTTCAKYWGMPLPSSGCGCIIGRR